VSGPEVVRGVVAEGALLVGIVVGGRDVAAYLAESAGFGTVRDWTVDLVVFIR
jgi:hypothetical protein